MSGDFSKTILNIKSLLERISQDVTQLSGVNDISKKTLRVEIKRFNELVQSLHAENEEDIKKATMRLESLIEEMKQPIPDEDEINTRGKSFLKASKALSTTSPSFTDIANQILDAIKNKLL